MLHYGRPPGARTAPAAAPRRTAFALLPAALLLLPACDGDTLYDDGPTGPVVAITSHAVALDVAAPGRAELNDSIRVAVTAADAEDGSGIARLGATALVLSGTDTTVVSRAVDLTPAPGATVRRTFGFTPADLGVAAGDVPRSLRLEVHAFAVNGAGACAAAVETEAQSLSCREFRGDTVAAGASGRAADVRVVEGTTVRLPSAGRIADALIDGGNANLFLSNQDRHRLEVLNLSTMAFRQSVPVGSEPWGLALNRGGDTVIVANSGGTNLSFVPVATMREDLPRRLQTPNTVLWEVTIAPDTLGRERYKVAFYDFSDRPQFAVQDFTGRILYSTRPTEAAPLGTIRYTEMRDGWQRPEVHLLFTDNAIDEDPNRWSLTQIDSLAVAIASNRDRVVLYDHRPGFPGQLLATPALPIDSALANLRAQGSDVRYGRGAWDLGAVGFSDTTFVAVSENRRWAAFGEGNRAPAGRIIMWDAEDARVSGAVEVVDLVNNASEVVHGVGLTADGTFGVARGTDAAYFFDRDLRLRGEYAQGLEDGAGGATFRPGAAGAGEIALVGTARSTIQLIESTHYLPVAEIEIRDRIVGPLRAAPPLPGDNAGLSCPGSPACVSLVAYGVTSGGGVVVVRVRERDLQ